MVFVRRENFAGFERDASNELVLLEHREDGVAYHVGAIWEGNDPLAATEQGFLSFVEEEFNHPPFYVTFPVCLSMMLSSPPFQGPTNGADYWIESNRESDHL